jgi:SP family galactose:H+ symporter-like MFS transporter
MAKAVDDSASLKKDYRFKGLTMKASRTIKNTQEHFFLFITAAVAALGGFLFGYDTGIISGALVFIEQTWPVSTFMQEIIVSSVVFGALMGAMCSGWMVDRFGSRCMLIYMAVMFITGTLISTIATNVYYLILGRLVIGIAIGVTSYVSPLFISEMAPAAKRGTLVLLNGIMITSGETIAFLVDYFLVPTQSWRLMFITGLVPAVLLYLGMLMLPPSPRWMALKGHISAARDILGKIRQPHLVDAELADILHHALPQQTKWRQLFSRLMRPVLIIGLGLGILQQFVGINTVMYYGPAIFKTSGFRSESAQLLATFAMGLMNTVMSIIAVLIVDKIGRRQLLLGGMTIAGSSLFIVGLTFIYGSDSPFLAWTTLIFMMLYIAGYSLSLGSLFWLVIAEIYPLNIRGMAMSFVTAVQWGANFIVTLTFLSILGTIGPACTFWLYGLVCVTSFIFCYYLVPETRGVSLEHIEKNLRLGKPSRQLGQVMQ